MFEYAMPSLGADMESGTILSWYVKPGDVVARGQLVGLVDTEKAEIEIEIWTPGRIERILVEPGREVVVGTPLLALSEPGLKAEVTAKPPPPAAPPPAAATPAATTPAIPTPARAAPIPQPSAPAVGSEPVQPVQPEPAWIERPRLEPDAERGGRIRATPLARRLARERAIDLASLHGTGPEGRIRAEDVRAAGTPTGPAPARSSGPATPVATGPAADTAGRAARGVGAEAATVLSADRLAAIARGMAAAMSRSKREIPHYYLALDVDLSHALAWLEAANRERPISERLLLQVLLLKATAKALAEVPELNGHWLEHRFVPAASVHLGVAITVRGGGLLAPALHDVDRRDLDDLMRGLSDLVARTRRGKLRGAEVRDATATVSSLADRGPDRLYGVIYPPQVALVGFGGVRERPWAENGLLGVRPVLSVTLSADHRASDGLRGTRLLQRIARALAEPESLA